MNTSLSEQSNWARMYLLLKPIKLLLLASLCSIAVASISAQPAQIIIIRHGEKPADSDDRHLAPAGEKRAKKLIPYLKGNSELTRFGPPAALFATKVKKSGAGQRSIETIEPLSRDLNLPIQTPFTNDDYDSLAKLILSSPDYAGKTVLICWTHERIPGLIEALGIHPAPTKLDDNAYDHVYLINYPEKGGAAELKEFQQPMRSKPSKGKGDKNGKQPSAPE